MADDSEAGVLISASELSAILAASPPNGTTIIEMVASMVEHVNNTLYRWNNGVFEPVEGSNMASFSTVQELAQNINTYNEIAKGKGFHHTLMLTILLVDSLIRYATWRKRLEFVQ